MKKQFLTAIRIIPLLLLCSCSASKDAFVDRRLKISLQGGINYGGIVENTDMHVVPDISVPAEASVDAFTGATRMGYNLGAHVSQRLRINQIEAGLDYMCSAHTFNYIDAGNFFIGVRRLELSQLMIPVSYNLDLFRTFLPGSDLQLKIGILGQRNFVRTSDAGISLPAYTIHPWSCGLTLGLSAFPFHFAAGNSLGFFMDVYRGSQIYSDHYNQHGFEMPGSSFLRFGVGYKFQ